LFRVIVKRRLLLPAQRLFEMFRFTSQMNPRLSIGLLSFSLPSNAYSACEPKGVHGTRVQHVRHKAKVKKIKRHCNACIHHKCMNYFRLII